MRRDELPQHLSQISTVWTMLRQAHAGAGMETTAAQQLLMERYGGAARRYLLRVLGDADAADDLLQEFALALVRGSFRGADPQRQRFRFYVKSVLFHLVSKHRRKQRHDFELLPPDSPEMQSLAAPDEDRDRQFDSNWRDQLLARSWDALRQAQPVFHEVLRFRADHAELTSGELAEQVGRQLGKPLTADGVRQTLRRAREKFAELLLDEVAHSLECPTLDGVEDELASLNLLDYCRPALKRRDRPSEPS